MSGNNKFTLKPGQPIVITRELCIDIPGQEPIISKSRVDIVLVGTLGTDTTFMIFEKKEK
jgi:hypothetical protein